MKGWKYYNHAAIPTTEPHETVDLSCFDDGSIWKIDGGHPLFARWTSDFDCGYETNWWYVIKDTPFDISALKSKRRYEINKGKKNFEVRLINADEYPDQLLEVQIKAFSGWPEKYRPTVNPKQFKEDIRHWDAYRVYGAFHRGSSALCAYALLKEYPGHLSFNVLRAMPEYERFGVNAAMVAGIIEDYNERLSKRFFINDGERSIRHETAFQDYLEKYFGFRKAYCHLHIKYKFPMGLLVSILYPFRNVISKDGKIGSLVSAVLRLEELQRKEGKLEQ